MLRSKHLWDLVEATTNDDSSDPDNRIPAWVARAMLADLRTLQEQTAPLPASAPDEQWAPIPDRTELDGGHYTVTVEAGRTVLAVWDNDIGEGWPVHLPDGVRLCRRTRAAGQARMEE